MTTRPQSDSHLDADQLNAFAEGMLSAQERVHCLQHLSECAHCREIAFLAGVAQRSVDLVPVPSRRSPLAWWSIVSLGAATVTAIAIMAVLLYHSRQTPAPTSVQMAAESRTIPPPPMAAAPMDRAVTAAPRMQGAPKTIRAHKTTPKPETSAVNSRQSNGAVALESTTARAQGAAGMLSIPAPTAKSPQAEPSDVAKSLPQPSQAQGAENPGAMHGMSMRSYNAATSLRPLGTTAQISGTVTDGSGATIAHAKVVLDQTSTSAHRETFTDSAGQFTIDSLEPGKYRLVISSPGFTAQVREVELGTSQVARVDSQLPVGSTAETVAVQAAAPALKTESSPMRSILPTNEPLQTSVSSGTRTLALDAAGRLFLSKKAGKQWKPVHGPWKKSTVTELSLTPDQSFRATTAKGSWLSTDGEHWRPED